MIKSIGVLLVAITLFSCNKNCPNPGSYRILCTGTYPNGSASNESAIITISATTKKYFYVGNSKIDKEGKKVEGEMFGIGNYTWLEIEGECKKKIGKQHIVGTYKAGTSGGGPATGTFEIKPK